jgi:hypothetical protein
MTTTTIGGTAEMAAGVNAAASASLALDIGTERGALVIYPAERFRDREIEISRDRREGHRVHTGVHERTSRSGSMLTAVFGSLPPGDYVVWETDTKPASTIAVRAGEVTEIRLS